MALDPCPHGPAVAPAMVESRFPGEACLVRHHGRNTSRRDHFARAGELDPGWTTTAPDGTLRPDAHKTREVEDRAYRGRLRILGTERTMVPLRQGLEQTVSKERRNVPGQDPRNDRRLGQPDGRGNDPALEPANQGLDHVPPLRGEQTHL